MTEGILQGGCLLSPEMRRLLRLFPVTAVIYATGVAASASLLSLVALILSGPFIGQGERFESLGIAWLNSQPFVLLGSAVSMALYSRYRDQQPWLSVSLFFLANAATVALAAALMSWAIPVHLVRW